MILETIRIVADALNHPSRGVNAILATLPKYAGDPNPMQVVQVLDVTRSDEAARREAGTNWPVLLVSADAPAQSDGEVGTIVRDADSLLVSIRYVTDSNDQARYVTDAMYTMRAIVKSLRELLRNENVASRQANDINVVAANIITWGPVEEQLGSGTVAGLVQVDFFVRDTAP